MAHDNIDLFRLIGTSIQVRHIAVPISSAVMVRVDEATELAVRRFDPDYWCAPVVNPGGRIVGVFDRRLPGVAHSVRDEMRPLDSGLLISSDTSIEELAAHLAVENFLLVVSVRSIAGFVTPSDMGSAPARTYFYLLLADLEVSMAALVRGLFADEPAQLEAISLLPASRQKAYWKLSEELHDRDAFQDPVAALSLADLVGIAGRTDFRSWYATSSAHGWSAVVRGLAPFRNDVMHPVRVFTKATPEHMTSLSRQARNIQTLASAARRFLLETAPKA